jgi:serine/threonine-protein kinase
MERIGEYLVHRLVGEGGMGKVYEAEERLSKRKVALKVLRAELSKSEEGRTMFVNEMRILAQLEHPNLVRSLASLEHEGQLVMVLELLEGRTLRTELTARGRLPWSEAVEIAAQIAEALAVAHAQEPAIVHRDLKPENVMLLAGDAAQGEAPRVKVMDFGVAKVLEAARATNTQSLGTLQYMSPEQIDARGVDARSDLYALGLVLYEMLAGEAPFRSASPRELLNLQCTAAPAPFDDEVRRGLPRAVDALVRALLEKDPQARPASAREVLERLAPLRPTPAPEAERGARRSDAPSAGGARSITSEKRPTERVPSAGDRPSGAPSDRVSTLRSAREVPRTDTIALLEAATAPREVPAPIALLVIVALSLLAAIVTVLLRVRVADGGSEIRADRDRSAQGQATQAGR